jgi:YVTN family beta-propeller protein
MGHVSPVVTFASIASPTAVAATRSAVLVLSGSSCATVYSVAANGTVTTFATLVTSVVKCPETAIAISPGLGNFPAGEVFVLLKGHLFEIPAGGSALPVASSLTLANLTSGTMGLTFDATGSFGYTLIATGGSRGAVVEIDAALEVQTVGSFGTAVEGPSVAPAGFGSVGGNLLAAKASGSTVFAMTPSGSTSTFAAYGSPAEGVAFIPTVGCSFSTTGDSYFVADTSANSVLAVPASAFASYTGLGLVLSEHRGAGAGLLSPNGTTAAFLKISGTLEGASYVSCPAGVAKSVDLAPHGLNGTALNLIGFDPVTGELIGTSPTTAPSQVFVLNGSTAAFVQNVSTGLYPSAVAYNPCSNRLYIANQGSDNLTVLNASTFQELGNVSTGSGSAPVGVAYDTSDHLLYVANSGTNSVGVFPFVDTWLHNLHLVLPLTGQPLGLIANPFDGDVYVVGNVGTNGTVWEIHWFWLVHNTTVGLDAGSIAVNNGTGTLYVTANGSNELFLLAPGDNVTATVALPHPVGVAFDSRTGLVFVDREDGNMTVLQGTSTFATYPFGGDPGPLVYDPVSDLVWGAADVTVFGLDPRIIIGGAGGG